MLSILLPWSISSYQGDITEGMLGIAQQNWPREPVRAGPSTPLHPGQSTTNFKLIPIQCGLSGRPALGGVTAVSPDQCLYLVSP